MTVDTQDQNALRGVAYSMNTSVSCIWKTDPSGSAPAPAPAMVREIEKLPVRSCPAFPYWDISTT